MTKFKVGDKVRIIDASHGFANVSIGDVGEIASYDKGVYQAKVPTFSKSLTWSGTEKCFELAFDKPTKNQRITTLESEVAELKAKVEALEKAQLSGPGTVYLHGKPIGKIDAIAALSKSPNEQRKAIIAEAKAFVKGALNRDYKRNSTPKITDTLKTVYFTDESYGGKTDEVVFHVNSEKRTVVAIVRTILEKDTVHKGIAKCAPDDVFNADIGKAIALGRALGLDVSRFEQAVKPTEVVVGQVYRYQFMDRDETQIITAIGGDFAKFKRISDDHTGQHELGRFKKGSTCAGYSVGLTLLDDTEVQY